MRECSPGAASQAPSAEAPALTDASGASRLMPGRAASAAIRRRCAVCSAVRRRLCLRRRGRSAPQAGERMSALSEGSSACDWLAVHRTITWLEALRWCPDPYRLQHHPRPPLQRPCPPSPPPARSSSSSPRSSRSARDGGLSLRRPVRRHAGARRRDRAHRRRAGGQDRRHLLLRALVPPVRARRGAAPRDPRRRSAPAQEHLCARGPGL